jgi:hypothetical protein
MSKKVFLLLLTCLVLGRVNAQNTHLDTAAVTILDKMSRTMGELTSLSATIKTNYDVSSEELGLVKHSDVEHLYVGGPDELMISSEGDKGSKRYYYNGKRLCYYSVDKNHYAEEKAPGTVVEMIDSMNRKYGIMFPLADFLYPGFVDDILADASSLELLGITQVDGKDCYHIAGMTKDKSFQFWISDDAFYLPMKLVIVHLNRPLNPQYEATYCDWQINPSLPPSIFEFDAPPGATKIKFHSSTAKK